MAASMTGGGATKPNQSPIGVNGKVIATASATSDDAASTGSGRFCHGRPLVRIMNITRICVAIDSRNHVVRNSSGEALNTNTSAPKVKKSNSEESGPMIAANRIRRLMSHNCGQAVACELTVSKGC